MDYQENISMFNYVDITSGGAGESAVAKNLIANLVTSNGELPVNTLKIFSSADEVMGFFGSDSTEYALAVHQFSLVSKKNKKVKKIMFSRYAKQTVTAYVYGGKLTINALDDDIKKISAGGYTISLDGTSKTGTGLDLSGSASFTAAATKLQAHLQALGSPFDSTLVTWSNTRYRFEIDTRGAGIVTIEDGAQSPLKALGFLNLDAKLSAGIDAQNPIDVMSAVNQTNNGFGSFAFIDKLDIVTHVSLALWNKALNVKYVYMVPVTQTDAVAWSAELKTIGSTQMVYDPEHLGEYHYNSIMATMSAIDYNAKNGTVDFDFTQDGALTAGVTNDTLLSQLKSLRIAFYGRTQENGKPYEFMQNVFLCGTGTDLLPLNVHANEQWLKSYATAQCLEMQLKTGFSASRAGETRFENLFKRDGGVIDAGLNNGTIVTGKKLTVTEQLLVDDLTGVENSYINVETDGSFFQCHYEDYDDNGTTKKKMVYLLIYACDERISKIEGSHTAI